MKSNATHAPCQIALDGPSASGKSTVGALLAKCWDCDFLDTGMMYRAVTRSALQNRLDMQDADVLGQLATSMDFAVYLRSDGRWRLKANGHDITDQLYSDDVNRRVSEVSAVSAVREPLVRKQRTMASENPIVMAGRDIGTVVLVDAPLKIYLDASPVTRAQRRTQDVDGNTQGQDFDEVLRSINRRDEVDSNRAHSPLRPAQDAITISTDGLNPEEVVRKIVELAMNKESFSKIDGVAEGSTR